MIIVFENQQIAGYLQAKILSISIKKFKQIIKI